MEIIEKVAGVNKYVVRFLDDGDRQETVPGGRLIVPWADREPWLADERKMAAVVEVSYHAEDTPQYEAVYRLLVEWELIDGIELGYNWRECCSVQIENPTVVCQALGWDRDTLLAEPLTYVDRHGVVVAPWSLAVKIARQVAELNGDAIMEKVVDEEYALKLEAVHGRTIRDHRTGELTTLPPEYTKERRARSELAMVQIRKWCGVKAIRRHDELEALRKEVFRLGNLVERAIRELRRCGQDAIAATMEKDLGVPISSLKSSPLKRRS
ncbi:hypothetical protein [Thermoactinospora rubra]|uniref:hypothetical protein n=1 Tax=Thermoactinospora rubra TaxID=1088767 RepID=UPI000A0FD0E4|nr:hypothetical protein [Thermoactinospora rubra]